MIKVVIDTSVVVSAAFRDRTPEEVILFIVEQDEFEWIASPSILDEYIEVLGRRKFNLSQKMLREWRGVFVQCTLNNGQDIEIDFPRDQKDAKFLGCAVSAEADYLITGDADFEEARKFISTTIISFSQFKKLVMARWL